MDSPRDTHHLTSDVRVAATRSSNARMPATRRRRVRQPTKRPFVFPPPKTATSRSSLATRDNQTDSKQRENEYKHKLSGHSSSSSTSGIGTATTSDVTPINNHILPTPNRAILNSNKHLLTDPKDAELCLQSTDHNSSDGKGIPVAQNSEKKRRRNTNLTKNCLDLNSGANDKQLSPPTHSKKDDSTRNSAQKHRVSDYFNSNNKIGFSKWHCPEKRSKIDDKSASNDELDDSSISESEDEDLLELKLWARDNEMDVAQITDLDVALHRINEIIENAKKKRNYRNLQIYQDTLNDRFKQFINKEKSRKKSKEVKFKEWTKLMQLVHEADDEQDKLEFDLSVLNKRLAEATDKKRKRETLITYLDQWEKFSKRLKELI